MEGIVGAAVFCWCPAVTAPALGVAGPRHPHGVRRPARRVGREARKDEGRRI